MGLLQRLENEGTPTTLKNHHSFCMCLYVFVLRILTNSTVTHTHTETHFQKSWCAVCTNDCREIIITL
jgi:hypothetical protein